MLHNNIIAAPSWVMAGTIYENCVFLEDKVDEVGLLFFESDSCLAYTEEDLPAALADLNLRYHVHLPLDLPWHNVDEVISTIVQLMEKVAFLGVERAVLHPPIVDGKKGLSLADAHAALVAVATAWNNAGYHRNHLLIENIDGADLTNFVEPITQAGLGVCVDIGHIIAYGQDALLMCDDIWSRLGMVHLNAPKDTTTRAGRSKHASLTHLDARGKQIARTVLSRCTPDTILMYELFTWEHICSSQQVVAQLVSVEER